MTNIDGNKQTNDADIIVSLVINTYNEENHIAECIKSTGDLPDEITVCDMYSTDRTREVAESLGAKVTLHRKEPFVEKARRVAIEQARGEWILLLDADERTTPELLDELSMFIDQNDVNAVSVRWRFLFMNKFLSYTSAAHVWKPILFRRISYLQVAPLDKDCDLRKGNFDTLLQLPGQVRVKERIIHFAYPNLDKYVEKTVHRCSHYFAQEWIADGGRPNFTMLVIRPVRTFLISFFLRQGYKDGIRGFIFSVLYSVHYFLIASYMYDLEEK